MSSLHAVICKTASKCRFRKMKLAGDWRLQIWKNWKRQKKGSVLTPYSGLCFKLFLCIFLSLETTCYMQKWIHKTGGENYLVQICKMF